MTEGIRELEVLYDGPRTRVVRGEDEAGRRLVLKQLRSFWPTSAELDRLRREHALLSTVDGEGAPAPVALELGRTAWLATEDVGGVALARVMGEARASAEIALTVALGLARALARVHAKGVLHRDLNPSNCLVELASRRVWLIDFDLASAVPRRRARPQPLGSLEGTPAYLAPEQTGRTNRSVDPRSDLYALGVTLYELFAGRLPFERADLLGYVHAHLAAPAPPLTPVMRGLPAALPALVGALLRKAPEERYQSAEGVVMDLEAWLDDASAPTVGRLVGDQVTLPEGLRGRDREVSALRAALDGARAGAVEVVWIEGEAGVGKTSLVREILAPATAAGARVVSGKFDQFARDQPHLALRQALEAFCEEVLSAPTEEVERERERLLAAVAPNARLLLELAPSLEILLGPQPPVPPLGPTEAQRRLHETMRRALRAVASAERPLVLFLDDLQWADLPSLRALETLLRDPTLAHLLLLGAWRAEEVGADHALLPTLDAVASTGVSVRRFALAPLAADDVEALVARALEPSLAPVAPLAAALHGQTHGNPFFLRRLLERANAEGALRFDVERRAWGWDLAAIRRLGPSDNVVGLLSRELSALTDETRRVLAAASLLGDELDAEIVRDALDLSAEACGRALAEAVRAQIISPVDDGWWAGAARARFTFVHDRLQQVARELLPEGERARTHLALARALSTSPDRLFAAAEHWALAATARLDDAERARVHALLARAGHRALESSAFDPAHRFFEAALALGGLDADPEGARRTLREAARAAWLVGDRARMATHLGALRERARDPVDRLRAEEVVVQARIAAGELHEALDAALAALSEVGVVLERRPGPEDVQAAIGGAMATLGDRDADAVSAKRLEGDAVERAARGLLVRIASAAYVAEPSLLPLIACELVRRTVERGASAESAYGFGVYSLCLCAGWMLEEGTAQGRTALALQERLGERALEGPVRHVVHHYPRVWNDSLRRIYEDSPDVHRALMDAGDLEYAGWVLHMRVLNGVLAGVSLDELALEADRAVAVMRLHDVQAALHCTLQLQRLIAAMRGETDDPARLDGDGYDEAALLEGYVATDFRAAALVLSVCRLMARSFSGDREGAAAAAEDVLRFADGALALFYQVTMRVQAAAALLDAGVDRALERARELRAPVAACAAHNPASGAHLLALLDAELARAEGDGGAAARLYEEAIDGAERSGFVHHAAWANERAAAMHLDAGADRMAEICLRDARHAWQRWGATAQVARLEREHRLPAESSVPRARSESSSGSVPSRELDLDSVLQASQAIAEEVSLDALLARAMEILLSSVSARRGALLLTRRGELALEATGAVGEPARLRGGAPLEAEPSLPVAIVRRVWRGGRAEVHDDDGRSVLCAPIQHRGRTLGVVCFENDLAEGAFGPDRVRVLEMLAPQLAVSVRNVRLQEAQHRFVPAQFLRSLGRQDIVDVEVGDHRLAEVTVFFSDIWGFTPLVERLSAETALAFVNRYLSFAEPAITGSGGFIDSYLGDGIMALFDEPDVNPQRAVSAAIAVHRSLERFNLERRRGGLPEVRTGVGLNTGEVTLGTIGGPHAIKCGVVGDAVNVAARIETLTRWSGSRVLVSDQTVARLVDPGAFTLRRAGRVRVRGRARALTLFEVLDAEPAEVMERRLNTRAGFEAALEAFEAGRVDEAIAGFEACLRATPADRLARRSLERAHALAAEGVPEGWDGVADLPVG